MWASTKWVFMYVWFSLYVPLARLTSPEALPEKTIFSHITCGIALHLQEIVQAAFFKNLAGQMNFKKLRLFRFSVKTKVFDWRLNKNVLSVGWFLGRCIYARKLHVRLVVSYIVSVSWWWRAHISSAITSKGHSVHTGPGLFVYSPSSSMILSLDSFFANVF